MSGGVSLVIETENLAGGGRARAVRMMNALRRQVADRTDVELIAVFDEEDLTEDEVHALFAEGGLTELGLPIKFLGSADLSYYEAKNLGSRWATGDVLVFVDCDVLPEEGWLDGLLSGLEQPGVEAVGGSTFIGPLESITDKAFAAFWFFPLRSDRKEPHERGTLDANNMAVRREFFLERPFPPHEELDRGQCTMWGRDRLAEGIRLWRVPARAAHPSPKGHVFKRGLWRGQDRYIRGRDDGKLRGGALLTSIRMFVFEVGDSARKIRKRRRKVGLSLLHVPAAFGIALYYWTAEWTGFLAEWLRPGLIRRRITF